MAVLAVVAGGAGAAFLAARPVAADTTNNGTFRYLTQSFPTASTNSEYVARVLTANADGAVTFTMTSLPPGTAYDAQSGFITGRPTVVGNYDVDISATDGTNTIVQNNVLLKVNASGGGGNAGSTFDVTSLPPGTVGTPYAYSLTVSLGVGPYTFGATDLPPGITLRTDYHDPGIDGDETGELSGTPTAPGTWFVSLTVVDAGEGNKVVKVLPLPVLPSGSSFQITTRFLNSGEVGTPFYDLWQVSGAAGPVAFGASGLPAGLTVDAATGIASGTPAQAGTFAVRISATDGTDAITTNLSMIVVPSSTSSMYWDFFGLPAALVDVPYQRQPPILLVARNGTTVTYAAVGIPSGMSYSTTTGELTGTPVDVGEYPITFTATDSATGEVLTLSLDFVVLPPYGGDASSISVNLWVSKQALRTGDPGKDSWAGQAIWNADRRAANVFDPATDAVLLQIGSHAVQVDAGLLAGTPAKYAYASPRGEAPAVKVQLSVAKQTLKWSVKNDSIGESVPGTLRQTAILGGRGYRADEAFDARGVFKPALAYRRTVFVAAKGTIAAPGAGKDAAKLSLLLADPSLAYTAGSSALRFRILDGATELFSRDFTALGAATTSEDPGTGVTVYRIKALKDPAATDRVAKFTFASNTGKMTLALANLTLTGVPATEAHLGLELTVGDRIYYTAVTFFEASAGKYATLMPR